MRKIVGLIAPVCGGLLLKFVAGSVTAGYLTWTWAGLAETLMGHRAALDGAGQALAAVTGMILGFALGTAALAALVDRRRRLRAIALTVALYAAAFSFAIGSWVREDPDLKIGGALITNGTYVKWPPLQSAWQLDDRLSRALQRAVPADLVLVVLILAWPGRRARGLSTASTSPAAT